MSRESVWTPVRVYKTKSSRTSQELLAPHVVPRRPVVHGLLERGAVERGLGGRDDGERHKSVRGDLRGYGECVAITKRRYWSRWDEVGEAAEYECASSALGFDDAQTEEDTDKSDDFEAHGHRVHACQCKRD